MAQVPASSHGAPFSGGTISGNVEIDGEATGTALEIDANATSTFDVFRVRGAGGDFLIETFSDGGTTFQSDDATIEAVWVQHLQPAASVDAFVVADTSGNRKLRVAVNGNIGLYGHAPAAQSSVTSGTVTPEQLALALQANGTLGGT